MTIFIQSAITASSSSSSSQIATRSTSQLDQQKKLVAIITGTCTIFSIKWGSRFVKKALLYVVGAKILGYCYIILLFIYYELEYDIDLEYLYRGTNKMNKF